MQQFVHLLLAYATIVGVVGSAIEAATLQTGEQQHRIDQIEQQLQQQLPLQHQQATFNVERQQQEFPSSTVAAVISEAGADFVPVTLGSNIDFHSLEFSAISPQTNLDVEPCSLSDPELDECLRALIQSMAPRLKNTGLPEYNMISIDPYFYKRGIFRYANDGIQGGLLIKNMNIHGISTLKLNSVLSNFTDNGQFIIKLNAELPQLRADGHFKADVKFGGLRLVPKGPFNITIDDIKATVLTDGTIERMPDGRQRVRLHRLNANVNIGDARIIANGIFSDRNLNAMILNLVNENLLEITRVGIPATREQWAPILVEHINEFFSQVPIEKFLVQ